VVVAQHGDADQAVLVGFQDLLRQAHGLPTEHQAIPVGPGHLGVPPLPLGAEEPEPLGRIPGQEVIPVVVVGGLQFLPVVQPRPAQVVVRGLKAQGVDEVQPDAIVHAEAANASGILRNLGLVQDDVEHGKPAFLTLIFDFPSILFSAFRLYESL